MNLKGHLTNKTDVYISFIKDKYDYDDVSVEETGQLKTHEDDVHTEHGEIGDINTDVHEDISRFTTWCFTSCIQMYSKGQSTTYIHYMKNNLINVITIPFNLIYTW